MNINLLIYANRRASSSWKCLRYYVNTLEWFLRNSAITHKKTVSSKCRTFMYLLPFQTWFDTRNGTIIDHCYMTLNVPNDKQNTCTVQIVPLFYSIVLFIPSQKNNQGSLPTKQLFWKPWRRTPCRIKSFQGTILFLCESIIFMILWLTT